MLAPRLRPRLRSYPWRVCPPADGPSPGLPNIGAANSCPAWVAQAVYPATMGQGLWLRQQSGLLVGFLCVRLWTFVTSGEATASSGLSSRVAIAW